VVKNYREGSSPEKTALEVADGFKTPAGNSVGCAVAQATKASAPRPPGITDRIEPVQAVFAVTMEILPSARASSWRAQHLPSRSCGKKGAGGGRKSEGLIRALTPGNAGRAKEPRQGDSSQAIHAPTPSGLCA
jgi:hypothetical protein